MPGLKAFLQKTMIFTAAAPTDLYSSKLAPMDPIVPVAPGANSAGKDEDRAVWNWTHDPSSPAKITALNANVRAMNNMNMTVCDSIEVERVAISLTPGSPVLLPLDVDHVVAKFKLDKGHIPESWDGWWRIEANTDWAMAVVFAYEIVRSLKVPEDAPKIFKVNLNDLEADSAFPNPPARFGDPDYMDPSTLPKPPGSGTMDGPRTLENTVTAVPPRHFVIVVFGLTTCKERGDFEPGGVLGAGRVYPHVMVLSSERMVNAEATIHLKRPAQGMKDDDMNGKIGPLLATDANEMHGPTPIWSNVFDYVVTNPFDKIGLIDQDDRDASGANWMTVVDQKKPARTIVGKIMRETLTHIPSIVDKADFTKMKGQGEFDNLHLAPGMIYDPLIGPKETFIKMAPFCVHDCFHTHFRWGSFMKDVQDLPKSEQGLRRSHSVRGRIPPARTATGKPLVPFDQTVKIGLTSASSFRYFAKTSPDLGWGAVYAGVWTVFNHHGSWATRSGSRRRRCGRERASGVAAHIIATQEPYATLVVITSFNPVTSTPAFYFRLRFTGFSASGAWVERVQILDLSTTTGVRS